MKCVLCESKKESAIKETFSSEVLKHFYKKYLGIDISAKEKFFNLYECEDCNLNYFDSCVEGDDNFYKRLSKNDWYYQSEKMEYEIIGKFISDDMKVLDVGAGVGSFYKYIKSNYYLGLETSLTEDIKINDKASVINNNLEEISKELYEFFDVVVIFQVLEHIQNPKTFINNALKVLKKDGFLIISVPDNDSYIRFLSNPILNFPPHHYLRWNEKSLYSLSLLFDLYNPLVFKCGLDKIHYDNFSFAIADKILKNIFRIKISELNDSLLQKIINRITKPLKLGLNYLLNKKILQPFGHSIIAIYRKRS